MIWWFKCALLCYGDGEVVAPWLRHPRTRGTVALCVSSCAMSHHKWVGESLSTTSHMITNDPRW